MDARTTVKYAGHMIQYKYISAQVITLSTYVRIAMISCQKMQNKKETLWFNPQGFFMLLFCRIISSFEQFLQHHYPDKRPGLR